MSIASLSGVRVAGVAAAVPSTQRGESDLAALWGAEEARKIASSTGVLVRRIATPELCASDLCFAAAQSLIAELGEDVRAEIDLLIFVSQTPDYMLPATACVLHGKLGLSKGCAAFDVNLGCSGYIYALWMAAGLLSARCARRALLLVGDTITKCVSEKDRATAPLFGDAGTATLLEGREDSGVMHFVVGTDGKGAQNLIVPAGGSRNPSNAQTSCPIEREGGNLRSEEQLYMNGPEIFTFTLREIPPLIEASLANAGWTFADIDAIVFHQANKFMLDYLAKRMKVPPEKFVVALDRFGNTSSASIPLALVTALGDPLRKKPMRLLLTGFGVGYSWGSAAIECGPLVVPKLGELPQAT